MDLKALRYFLKAASTGSFQETARYYGVPGSSVSRFISALEKEVGHQLFYRSTRAIRLTVDGAQFHLQVREALEQLDSAVDQLGTGEGNLSGLVKVNAPVALGRLHIASALNDLQSRHPALHVELTLTDDFVDPVQEGADITVRVGPLVDSSLLGRVVSAQRFILAASPEYLARTQVPQAPVDLKDHQCLLYKGLNGRQRWYFQDAGAEGLRELDVSGPLESNNAEVLVAAAIAGRGIVLFPTWMFKRESFEDKKLVSLLPDWHKTASSEEAFIQLLSPENRLRSRKVREVSEFLLHAIGTPPYWDNW